MKVTIELTIQTSDPEATIRDWRTAYVTSEIIQLIETRLVREVTNFKVQHNKEN